jgi:hypothetical protein
MPQETTMPAIVFYRVSTARDTVVHSGPEGIAEAVIQVSIYSESIANARLLSENVRKLFHRYKGTVNTISIMNAKVIGERDLYDSDLNILHIPMEIMFRYQEATA